MNKPTFQRRTKWNDHYEIVWRLRTDLLKKLYEGGERHPLRLLRLYESILRLSSGAPGIEGFQEDDLYADHLHSNVRLENGSTVIDPAERLPTGPKVEGLGECFILG